MKKLFSFKRLFLGFRIYSYEFIYIVNVWLCYLCFRYLHKHDEPKHYFFESFKNNNEYTQICFNQTYKIQTEHYEHFHKRLVSNHQFNWWFIISPPKGYCYYSPQRAVSQALLLARYKAVLLESSRLDSSACSFIYF